MNTRQQYELAYRLYRTKNSLELGYEVACDAYDELSKLIWDEVISDQVYNNVLSTVFTVEQQGSRIIAYSGWKSHRRAFLFQRLLRQRYPKLAIRQRYS